MLSQQVSVRQDNVLLTILKSIPFIALGLFLSSYVAKRNTSRRLIVLELIVMVTYFLSGTLLILFGKTCPAADAMSVYAGGASVAVGDFSVFAGDLSYFSFYPFQIGLSLFESPFIWLWNLVPFLRLKPAYHGIKFVYVLLIVLSVHIIRKITDLLGHSAKATCTCLLLLWFNLPIIMYSSFVYGEIPGLVLFLCGFYNLLRFVQQAGPHPKLYFFVAIILCGLCVLVRKNSLILIIAVCIPLGYEFLRTRQKRILAIGVGILASVLIIPMTCQFYVEHKSGYKFPNGVTGLSYVAMGMQESSRCAGWYNGYNFITYQDANQDAAKANLTAKEDIKKRISIFCQDPAYALDFYWRKFTSLWCDGTYACRQATLASFGYRPEFLNQLYGGKYQSLVVDWCDIYQNFLHIGLLIYVLSCLFDKSQKREFPLLALTFVIAMIGGFIFHMVWEANSRYIFPYGILLLPIAAQGLTFGIPFFKQKGN